MFEQVRRANEGYLRGHIERYLFDRRGTPTHLAQIFDFHPWGLTAVPSDFIQTPLSALSAKLSVARLSQVGFSASHPFRELFETIYRPMTHSTRSSMHLVPLKQPGFRRVVRRHCIMSAQLKRTRHIQFLESKTQIPQVTRKAYSNLMTLTPQSL